MLKKLVKVKLIKLRRLESWKRLLPAFGSKPLEKSFCEII